MKPKGGFTLIEILVAVAIAALITTIVISGVNLIKQRTRDSTRVSHLADLQKGLDLYLNQTETYPISIAEICLNGTDPVSTALLAQNTLSRAVRDPIYPSDPTFCYQYQSNALGSAYSIRYFLETSFVQAPGYHTVTN